MARTRTRDLARISSNLNQIARWANTYKTLSEAAQIVAHFVAIERKPGTLAVQGDRDDDSVSRSRYRVGGADLERMWSVRNFMPAVVMGLSISVLTFLGGVFVGRYRVFPYPYVRSAWITGKALITVARRAMGDFRSAELSQYVGSSSIPAGEAAEARWTVLDIEAPRRPVLALGGLNQYRELCPDHGCLAVAFDAGGNVTETWPWRPRDIYAADVTHGAYPHETLAFDPRTDIHPIGMKIYAGGDFLVSFHAIGSRNFPYAAGVTRMGPDGEPRWTRFDYSHHWPTLDADGIAYVPGLKIGDEPFPAIGGRGAHSLNLPCDSGRPILDTVQVIDGDGRLIEEIELMPILLRSNRVELVRQSERGCDPLHLNYIDIVGADAGPGLVAGDLVLSLRNLSRFAILDPRTRRIKRVVGGNFVGQHSVRHLSDSKFLIFDNLGGDSWGPPSRVVELDLATGVERRIFPNADAPEAHAEVFSKIRGHLDISPDRSRVLASFDESGYAYEVDIASGRVLAVYDNVHDLSSVPDAPEAYRLRAHRFNMKGMYYDTR